MNQHGTGADERLLIEAAQKDPRRFAELYESNFERVYVYIARRVRDRTEAQDLTSHVFRQALAIICARPRNRAREGARLYRRRRVASPVLAA